MAAYTDEKVFNTNRRDTSLAELEVGKKGCKKVNMPKKKEQVNNHRHGY